MTIQELFDKTVEANASDLHLLAGSPPNLRVDGKLTALTSYPSLTAQDVENLVMSILTQEQKELYLTNRSLDLSYGYSPDGINEKGRFRINLYFQKGTIAG